MTPHPNTPFDRRLAFFRGDDNGSMTILGLFFFLCMAIVGAFALDMANVTASRTHLQTAADQGAHAALYNRPLMDADDAKMAAYEVMVASLPFEKYGDATPITQIEFGVFNTQTRSFEPDSSAVEAVRVRTSFNEARSNAHRNFLFKLIGFDTFDLQAEAVYITYSPGCLREGFVSEGVVDIRSNNTFSDGFCVHSNTYVSLNSNNTFEPGTVVSMPDVQQLDLPKSGFDTNEGLAAALRASSMNIRILARIDNMIRRYEDPSWQDYPRDTEELPDYITSPGVLYSTSKNVTPSELAVGRVHYIGCTGNSGLTIDASAETLRDVVIISPCEITFSSGSSVENARVISKNTSSDSISSPSGLRIGRDDNCAEGGGAQLVTVGGMRFPADLQIYGSQLIARGDIQFAANATGVQGASLIAGGGISGTSNMDMGLCLSGMEDNIEIPYFRLAL